MPPTEAAFQAPSLALLASEPWRALFDFCAAKLALPAAPVGDGHPVIVYPGLGAGSLTTSHLRTFLRDSGFTVHDWTLGVNIGPEGDFHDWLDPLVERVRELHAQHGRKVSLVGWSLGGVYAREIAKRAPECVRAVITLGTPFHALADANHAGTLLKLLGASSPQLPPKLLARLRERPPVPTTSIYSRSDGVVCWRGCLEAPGPQVENIEVDASHLGMVSHPAVLRVLADRLARPERRWRRNARPGGAVRPASAPSRAPK